MSRTGFFPGDFLDRVREALPLSAYVSEIVSLRKTGRRFTGKCPLHPDSAPSFSVTDDEGLFYCFGCKKGGDIFKFVMEHEGVAFAESVEILADRAGIPLPQRTGSPKVNPRDRIVRIAEEANKIFRTTLHGKDGSGLEYLEKRGIVKATIETFELGLTPPGWDPILRALTRQGFRPEQIEEAGLVKRRASGGGYYDRFRSRITIPIRNRHGRLVAFGGRLIGQAASHADAKYLNSPETPVYTKGKNLFGLYQAKDAIRSQKSAIIVEGYFDMIRLFQAGIHNVAASLGTALTKEQLKLISGLADTVYLGYDSDASGLEAALRAVPDCLDEGFTVKVVRLPRGMDPDDYVAGSGPEGYRKLLDEAQDLESFLTDKTVVKWDITKPEQASKVIGRLIPVLKTIRSPLVRTKLVGRLAEKAGTDERVILEELRRSGIQREKAARSVPLDKPAGEPTVAELHLLKAALKDERIRQKVSQELTEDLYAALASAGLFRMMAAMQARGVAISAGALNELVEADQDAFLLAKVCAMEGEVTEEHAIECINALKLRAIKTRMKQVQQRLSNLTGDRAEENTLLREKQILGERLSTLEREKEL